MYTAEPAVPGPSHLEVETAITKLRKCISPGSDQDSSRNDSGWR
jgi:hypothetical protein